MLSKILHCTIEENESSIKAMFSDGSFFLKGFCKQFNIYLLFRSQRPKTTGICNKDPY